MSKKVDKQIEETEKSEEVTAPQMALVQFFASFAGQPLLFGQEQCLIEEVEGLAVNFAANITRELNNNKFIQVGARSIRCDLIEYTYHEAQPIELETMKVK